MFRTLKLFAFLIFCMAPALVGTPNAATQTEFTLSGEWIVKSSPLNGQMASPKGISLGFPERDMIFDQQGDFRTGAVLREDVGQNVKPLGVWRAPSGFLLS